MYAHTPGVCGTHGRHADVRARGDPAGDRQLWDCSARPASGVGGFNNSALSRAPGVLNALADEHNTLVYVRLTQARHAANYDDVRSRCTMAPGKARATYVEEARMKYGPPMSRPPL